MTGLENAPRAATRAALERVTAALDEAGCLPRPRGDHLDARCPAHDDHRPSLTVDWRDNPGRVLVQCHQGCATDDVVAALGLELRDLYDVPWVGRQPGSPRTPRPRPARKPTAPKCKPVERDHDCRDHRRVVTTYPYTDAAGTVVMEVVRQRCEKCGGKDFPIRRPATPDDDPTVVRKGWVWRWPDVRPLYRLPDVVAAIEAAAPVYLPEGEKDADAISAAGAAATCNPGGATRPGDSKWRPEHTNALRGAHVRIVADRDEAGYRHAANVAAELADVAASVTVLESAAGKDATDHLTAGHDLAALVPVDPAARLAELAGATDTAPAAPLTTVVNMRGHRDDPEFADVVYVGRAMHMGGWRLAASPFANPFRVGKHGQDAAEVVERYRAWLDEQPELLARLAELRGRRLGCWCHPEPCHAHVLAELANAVTVSVPAPEPESADDEPGAEVIPLPRRGGPGGGSGGPGGPGPRGPGGGDGDPLPDVERTEYRVVDGSLVKVATLGRGKSRRRRAVEILNARARITRRYLTDRGTSTRERGYDLEVTRDGVTVEVPKVLREDFESLTWLDGLPWDLQYAATHAGRSDVRNAIIATSGTPEDVDVFGLLGWRQAADGRWLYVHAGGAIDAAGPVHVGTDLPGQLASFVLPTPPTDADEVRAAFAASLMLLDRLPARIAAPLLGAAYRAVCGDVHAPLFLLGTSGTGKSSLAALALQHYAPTVRHNSLPVPAGEDTLSFPTLARLLNLAGDAVMVLDDLAPDRSAERSGARASQIIRLIFNGSGRHLSARDGGLRDQAKPRGLVVLTGEDGASTASAENRTHYVPVARGEVPIQTLAELSATPAANGRAAWTAALARWCAARMPMTVWLETTERDYTATLLDRSAADPGVAWRRASSAAQLAAGWRAALNAAVELGALDEDQAAAVWDRAWSGIVESLGRQDIITARRTPVERAADALRSALVAGRAHVAHRNGGPPDGDARTWGWDLPPAADTFGTVRPRGSCVGWTDGERLWLDPGAAVAAIEAQARSEGEPLNLTKRALGSALADAGVARTSGKPGDARLTVRLRLDAARPHVWEVPVTWLFEPPADDGQPTPDPTPPADSTDDLFAAPPTAPTPPPSIPTPPRAEQQVTACANTQTPIPASERFAAPAVVVADQWIGVLAKGRERSECVSLPDRLGTLAELLEWAATLRLGREHDHGLPDDGQVWLMPPAAAAFGLPDEPPSVGSKAAASHPALAALRDAGWNVNELRSWMSVYRQGGRTLRLVVPGWEPANSNPLLAGDPDAAQLADRIGEHADRTGIAYRLTPGVTGLDLLGTFRRKVRLIDKPTPPRPAKVPTLEDDFVWQRAPEPSEKALTYVHAYDANAMYLPAAGQAVVGVGDPRHVDAPEFDPAFPGYWKIEPPEPGNRLLPDPLNPTGRAKSGARWFATPTLAHVAKELDYDVRPLEAYVYDESSRFYEAWYYQLRAARDDLLPLADEDQDAAAVLAGAKGMYRAGIGMLAVRSSGRLWRPDHRHTIIATARVNLARKLWRAADQDQRFPLAIGVDCVLYASDDPDPASAAPRAIRLGTDLGRFKPKGSGRMADVAHLLVPGKRPDDVLAALSATEE